MSGSKVPRKGENVKLSRFDDLFSTTVPSEETDSQEVENEVQTVNTKADATPNEDSDYASPTVAASARASIQKAFCSDITPRRSPRTFYMSDMNYQKIQMIASVMSEIQKEDAEKMARKTGKAASAKSGVTPGVVLDKILELFFNEHPDQDPLR